MEQKIKTGNEIPRTKGEIQVFKHLRMNNEQIYSKYFRDVE